jgi:hypothetical protein
LEYASMNYFNCVRSYSSRNESVILELSYVSNLDCPMGGPVL